MSVLLPRAGLPRVRRLDANRLAAEKDAHQVGRPCASLTARADTAS